MDETTTIELTRQQRRAAGVFYTPLSVARYIVGQVLAPLLRGELSDLRVLDPACGDGVFLSAAYEWLVQWYGQNGELTVDQRREILLRHIFGIDQDGNAVECAAQGLAQLALSCPSCETPHHIEVERVARQVDRNLFRANTLLDLDRQWLGSFDAIVGNPPYINIRQLTKSYDSSLKQKLRENYQCARGAYDCYVLFIEQSLRLLRPGGICGFIVPNKLASLDYARACRRLLLGQSTIHRIDDLSAANVFPNAGVYPYIVIFQKQPPKRNHQIQVREIGTIEELGQSTSVRRIDQQDLSAENGFTIHGNLNIELRVATQPLAERASLHSGTTGFLAAEVARALDDCEYDCNDSFDFIVSGNIDRYSIQLGKVRFMRRTFVRPILRYTDACLTDSKRRLFHDKKIVVAGMTRRLEAAYDEHGLALGVQVFALRDMIDNPYFLLGLLNSKLMSYLFRLRFQAKRLAGNYLAVNKGQLAKLPICVIDESDAAQMRKQQRITQLVHVLQDQAARNANLHELDREIDQLVYELYRLTNSEADAVEAAIHRIEAN